MGQKPHDWQTVSLCKECHTRQHSIGEATFWNASLHLRPVSALIEAFCKASPKAREIREARNG
mgnify:FL=1